MSKIYDQHDKAFAKVSAFVIVKDNDRVATLAIKFPADGAGRLYAYLHVLCLEMVRGWADGYGYDKRSAAVEDAARRIQSNPADGYQEANAVAATIATALAGSSGRDWVDRLRDAGFTVWQAV